MSYDNARMIDLGQDPAYCDGLAADPADPPEPERCAWCNTVLTRTDHAPFCDEPFCYLSAEQDSEDDL